MCGRFTLRAKLSQVLDQFFGSLFEGQELRPRYNIAPTQGVPTIRVPEPGARRQLTTMHWGLIPSWAKDKRIAYSTINARGDAVATTPAFRSTFKRQRCLNAAGEKLGAAQS